MRYERIRKAKALLKEIEKNPSGYYVIHYSCESFYDTKEGKSPRITSIAVRSLATCQIDSFSIHKVAEKNHIAFADIEQHYDELERKMLDEYYAFILQHQNTTWIHWNMRNPNFGFQALDHRCTVLGGTPTAIPAERKIDFSRILQDKYGSNYIENPKLESLIAYNNLQPKDFLGGAMEAEAFEQKEFIRLHLSTISKVNMITNLVELTVEGGLKTKTKWREVYGVTPQGVFELSKDKWHIQLFLYILTLVLGGVIGKLL